MRINAHTYHCIQYQYLISCPDYAHPTDIFHECDVVPLLQLHIAPLNRDNNKMFFVCAHHSAYLRQEQIKYAATDAFACRRIWEELSKKPDCAGAHACRDESYPSPLMSYPVLSRSASNVYPLHIALRTPLLPLIIVSRAPYPYAPIHHARRVCRCAAWAPWDWAVARCFSRSESRPNRQPHAANGGECLLAMLEMVVPVSALMIGFDSFYTSQACCCWVRWKPHWARARTRWQSLPAVQMISGMHRFCARMCWKSEFIHTNPDYVMRAQIPQGPHVPEWGVCFWSK